MDELLKKLLEAEILTEDTKAELETAISKRLDEATQAAKQKAELEVRAELTEQWMKERDILVEAVDTKVSEFMLKELAELKTDIESFRDLEAEHAVKLVEAKEAMAATLKKDLAELVEELDEFLEGRIGAEFEELREDIAEQKRKSFGVRMFEAFVDEYKKNYVAEGSIEAKLKDAEAKIAAQEAAIAESAKQVKDAERKLVMEEVLRPLAGQSRNVMETILRNVETARLQEAYNTFIGRVLKESVVTETKEKEQTVLAEGKETKEASDTKVVEGVVATGDHVERLVEQEEAAKSKVDRVALANLRRLAGLE